LKILITLCGKFVDKKENYKILWGRKEKLEK